MENKMTKICKRCLLRDLSEADSAYIDQYKNAITERISEEKYETRLSICKECDFLNSGTCEACGCYVELRALAIKGKCPYKKW